MTDAAGSGEFPCDLCGSDEAVEVPHAREFTGGQPVHICTRCGFVYVRRRRSAAEIAATWTDEIFGQGYTARIPAVTARLTYVAEILAAEVGLDGKSVCEIGAGEGEFLELARTRGAGVFGIEPSSANCRLMADAAIETFTGTIEDFDGGAREPFDVVAILWTLENCQSCRAMLQGARTLLKGDGHVVVATGSRILVPFKKPLHAYLSKNPADTHAFRFSANTLQGVLAICGFEPTYVNRYLDNDVLCVIAKPAAAGTETPWQGDNYLAVWSFFERWYADTALYWPAPAAG
jgi:2-polyprenyl-3-methyl-5-hydroxy-6-metoxy-1,4-benzoquinol methylase